MICSHVQNASLLSSCDWCNSFRDSIKGGIKTSLIILRGKAMRVGTIYLCYTIVSTPLPRPWPQCLGCISIRPFSPVVTLIWCFAPHTNARRRHLSRDQLNEPIFEMWEKFIHWHKLRPLQTLRTSGMLMLSTSSCLFRNEGCGLDLLNQEHSMHPKAWKLERSVSGDKQNTYKYWPQFLNVFPTQNEHCVPPCLAVNKSSIFSTPSILVSKVKNENTYCISVDRTHVYILPLPPQLTWESSGCPTAQAHSIILSYLM